MAENIKENTACQPEQEAKPEIPCGVCQAVVDDPAKRVAFGYQAAVTPCQCHDIVVQDVRDIGVQVRTLTHCVPCNPDGRAGCRGGFLPDGVPALVSYRVMCAEENLAVSCDRINCKIEFEVVLRYGAAAIAVVTPIDIFDIMWNRFARFPSGVFYPNNLTGQNQFREELTVIDGSSLTIIFENVTVGTEGNDCVLSVTYKVIDKLWKYENLLVSAIKPYAVVGDTAPITITEPFGQGHFIGGCASSGTCGNGSPE